MEIECGERVVGAAEGWPEPNLLCVSMWCCVSVGCFFAAERPIRTPTEVIKHTYEMMDDFEYPNCGK